MATVHVHKSGEQGIFSNAYIVDTGHSLVVVDGTLTVSEARAFGARLKSLTKSLKAVLITHAHPDHVAGITEWLPSVNVPIYSVRSVEQLMRATEAPKRAQWGPVFKEEWVQQWTYPNRILQDRETIQVDGISFRVYELGPGGDCDANSIWIMETAPPIAFVGDLIFNGVHSYLADGHTSEWLANLTKVKSLVAGATTIYPGHGDPGTIELFDRQREYLEEYRNSVAELAGGALSLTPEQNSLLTERMNKYLGTERLSFLIGLSSDAVAKELAGQPAKTKAAKPTS